MLCRKENDIKLTMQTKILAKKLINCLIYNDNKRLLYIILGSRVKLHYEITVLLKLVLWMFFKKLIETKNLMPFLVDERRTLCLGCFETGVLKCLWFSADSGMLISRVKGEAIDHWSFDAALSTAKNDERNIKKPSKLKKRRGVIRFHSSSPISVTVT